MGPTTAIRNSAPGVVGEDSMRVTPPRMFSAMLSTPMPSSLATRAWPISCTSSEKKSRKAPPAPAIQ